MHYHDQRRDRRQRDRREITHRVIRELAVEIGKYRQGCDPTEQQRIAVGRGFRRQLRADHAARAGAVVDHDLSAPCFGDFLADGAGGGVVAAAWGEWDDEAYRLRGVGWFIVLCGSGPGGRARLAGCFPPWNPGCRNPFQRRHAAALPYCKINFAGGSPAAGYFLLLAQKESNQRKGPPAAPPPARGRRSGGGLLLVTSLGRAREVTSCRAAPGDFEVCGGRAQLASGSTPQAIVRRTTRVQPVLRKRRNKTYRLAGILLRPRD